MSSQLSDKTYCVYKHTVPNGKVYIGITKDTPERRWESGWGYKSNIYFFKAIVKYGWINIKHEVLYDGLSKEEAEQKEIELIAKYNSSDNNYGYNIDLGGFLHNKYEEVRKQKAEIKASLITAERNRLKSVEYTGKVIGQKVYKYDLQGNLLQTFETCKEAAKDANATYPTFQRWVRGKHPKNAQFIYSYGAFGEAYTKKYKQTFNAKPVDMFDLSLNLIGTFDSITEASKYINKMYGHSEKAARSNIHSVCNGAYSNGNRPRLTAYNYIWRYHNENQNNKIA